MKGINFNQKASEKIYKDYINRIKRTTSKLSKEDREDIMMEFNSHIYESMQRNSNESEVDQLMDAIEKLGAPEEVLKPMIAERTLNEATKTFNPFTVIKAIALNIGNGISYIFFAFLYLILFTFGFTIFAKLIWPNEVGMWFKDGQFQAIGMVPLDSQENNTEVLGNAFIPVMLLVCVALYFLITLLLRLKRKKLP